MKMTIDTEKKTLTVVSNDDSKEMNLYSDEAFEALSDQWVRVGWNQKYEYTLSWMGRPIIQLPEDMIRIQEVIYKLKPDVIIETGVAHGGSIIFYASLCKAMGSGRVIGIDIEIRKHNRLAIEEHELFPYINLIEGSSTDVNVFSHVKSLINKDEKVLVILDSCHTKQHVSNELELYYELVTKNSYIVVTDGIMKNLSDVPRGKSEWTWDNPMAAAEEFVERHTEFIIEQPGRVFNESSLTKNITHWPGSWLKKY